MGGAGLTADGSFMAANIARAVEIDRNVNPSTRAVDNQQAQRLAEHQLLTDIRRVQSAEQMRKDKVRRERDQRRRNMERDKSGHGRDNREDQEASMLDLKA